MQLKKVIILGPESTGKSTLCANLATHYSTLWCPEYAREYLLKNGNEYSYEDLLVIAKGQLALEDEYVSRIMREIKSETNNLQLPTSNLQLLFLDTDMYVMKVWCEYVFNKCPPFILEKAAEQSSDLYLLCNPDLPWVKDELREYPDLQSRLELYHIYKDLLMNQPVPWVIIDGSDYDNRLLQALQAVEKYIIS